MKCSFMFCLTRWDQDEVEAILGGGAFYFTILRDPVELFASAFDYYGLSRVYNMSLEEFAWRDKLGFTEFRVANDRLHMARSCSSCSENDSSCSIPLRQFLDASRSRRAE